MALPGFTKVFILKPDGERMKIWETRGGGSKTVHPTNDTHADIFGNLCEMFGAGVSMNANKEAYLMIRTEGRAKVTAHLRMTRRDLGYKPEFE